MSHPSYQVVPAPHGGWSVKKKGAQRASKNFATKEEAVEWALSLSKDKGTELYIHNKDGRMAGKHSFAKEPLPAKDW